MLYYPSLYSKGTKKIRTKEGVSPIIEHDGGYLFVYSTGRIGITPHPPEFMLEVFSCDTTIDGGVIDA